MHVLAESILGLAQQSYTAACVQSSCQIDVQFGDREGTPHHEYRIIATPTNKEIFMAFHRLSTGHGDEPGAVMYTLPRSDKQQFEEGVDVIIQHIVDDLDWATHRYNPRDRTWEMDYDSLEEQECNSITVHCRGRPVLTSRLLDGKDFEATIKRHLMNTRFLAYPEPM